MVFLTDVKPYPGPPLNVKVQYLPASNLILLTWDQPAINDRGAVIDRYYVEYYIGDNAQNSEEREFRTNQWVIKNPHASTQYHYRVSARSIVGQGTYSDYVEITTPDVIFKGKFC